MAKQPDVTSPSCAPDSENLPTRRPRSEAQREASRVNGRRGRGPTSDAGKAVSAANAVRHGLFSARLAPASVDSAWHAEFEGTLDALVGQLGVRTRAEMACAEMLASDMVQGARCREYGAFLMTDPLPPPTFVAATSETEEASQQRSV